MIRLLLAALLAGLATLPLSMLSTLDAAPAADAPADIPLYEDLVTPLVPKRPRSEQVTDHLQASALFAQGRLHFRRQNFGEALEHYQRAWRYDPQAESILAEIVPLAFALDRRGEAARYALLLADTNARGEPLLRVLTQLGVHLTVQEQWSDAVKLYEKVLQLQRSEPESSDLVIPLTLEIGRLHYLAGEYEKSADAFERFAAAMDDPQAFGISEALQKRLQEQDDVTYRLMADSFLRAGRLDLAEKMVRKAYAEDEPMLAFQLARLAARRDQVDAALEQLQTYYDSDLTGGGIEPYRLLEELLTKKFSDQHQAQAELQKRLEQLHAAHPDSAALAYFLGEKLLAAQQWSAAAKIFERFLEDDPTIEAYQALVRIYRHQQDDQRLLEVLGQVTLKTQSLEPLETAAEELAEDQATYQRLVKSAQAWEGEAEAWTVALAIAQLAARRDDWETANRFFEQAISQAGRQQGELLTGWGLMALMAERYQEAVDTLQRVLDQRLLADKTDAVYFYLAAALQMAERSEEAVRAARRAVALKPDSPRYHSRLAWILHDADKQEEAEKMYRQLLDRFGSQYQSEEVREIIRDARLALSNLAVLDGRMEEAEEWLEQVLDEYPQHIGALNDLGYLWADQGKHLERALAMTQQAVAAEPENEAYRDSLGWAYYRLGRYEKAVEQLRLASEGEAPDAVILDHLGDALWELEQTDHAAATWQRALEALESENDAQRVKEIQEKLRRLPTTN